MAADKMKKSSKIVLVFALIILAAGLVTGGIFAKQLETLATDLLSNLRYSGSAEISTIAEKIGLTGYGRFVFGATNPVVEDRDSFNAHCNSYDEDTSTLGCFGGGRIYVYNIAASELAGIKESTAAHELMHAVWSRLPSGEKDQLKTAILDAYNNSDAHESLKKELKNYGEDELLDELHSRLATAVKKLPEELEKHYAKYFEDQDKVVDFYNNYREPFEKLDAEFQELSDALEDVKTEFDEKQSEYIKRSEALSREIAEFNACADTLGCFSSQSTFNSRRNELVAESSALDVLYEELSKLVDEYNAKVEAYNNSILRGEELDSMMNSNSKINL